MTVAAKTRDPRMTPRWSRTTRATVAMLFVGMAIFSGLYSTQAMLPVLVDQLGLSSTEAAMTVSAATGGMALCVVPASILSERYGRGRVLVISTLGAATLGLLVPLATTGWALILLRGLQGAVMAGAPATAMAWLSEELDAHALPKAMGIYIAGNSVGGLTGRLIPTGAAEFMDWHGAIWYSSAVSFIFAVLVWVMLPKQERFHAKEIHLRTETQAIFGHWRNPRLALLFATGFLVMGTFVSLYNFIGFRLIEHFGMPPVLAGLIFLLYLTGTWSSARAGAFITQYGRHHVLVVTCLLMVVGAACTAGPLWLVLLGMALFTAGFFAAHSTASGWVGALATHDRAEASSMYVFCYYMGSSIVGALTGWAFDVVPWVGYAFILAALGGVVTVVAHNISD